MNRYANTPFVRYRHGTEINIQVSIKDSIEIFIKAYRGDGEQSFNKLIADIADGSGAGISMESTWFQAIRELFDHLREYPPAVQVQVKNQYIDVLQVLCESEFSEDAWNGIKTYFDQNMDTLSLWHFSHFKSMLVRSSPYRDKDGNVYDRETINNEENDVHVIGGPIFAQVIYSSLLDHIFSK